MSEHTSNQPSGGLLGGGIHQIKLILVFQRGGRAGVVPEVCDGIADLGVERGVGVGVDGVVGEELDELADSSTRGLEGELMVGADEAFGAVEEVLIDGQTIQGELFDGVAVLVDDLHLLDNSGLSALARA